VRFDALPQEDGVREPEEGVVFAVDEIAIASPYTPGDPVNIKAPPAAGELDFAVLLLAKDAGESRVGGFVGSLQSEAQRGWITTPDPEPVFEAGDPLIIYQYPGGRELMLAIDTEAVIETVWEGQRVRYRNNTEPGSSGSPVFSMSWELVALHHGGVEKPAPYNQGIPIALIAEYLQEKELGYLFGG